uniref:hypothetical protein n=1 Tax=Pontibacter litorisediminis TaxID=1846260 RepID=UPI0023ED0773
MAKQCILSLTILLSTACTAAAQAPVSIVNSKNTRYQLEREVVTRWGKFRPKWYFMLFHNKYRKGEDRRNIHQLAPTMIALWGNKANTEKQEEEVSQVYEQELFKAADRSLNKGYHLLYAPKFDRLYRELDALQLEAMSAGVDADMILKLRQARERIAADVEITREAYEDDAVKGEAFRGYLKDL